MKSFVKVGNSERYNRLFSILSERLQKCNEYEFEGYTYKAIKAPNGGENDYLILIEVCDDDKQKSLEETYRNVRKDYVSKKRKAYWRLRFLEALEHSTAIMIHDYMADFEPFYPISDGILELVFG